MEEANYWRRWAKRRLSRRRLLAGAAGAGVGLAVEEVDELLMAADYKPLVLPASIR